LKAVILAAGVGSRLRPITNEKPKALVKVCGKPILEYQLEAYLKAGLREEDITIVTGYKGDMIKEFCNKKKLNVRIIENREYLMTNNMYSLFLYLKEVFFKQGLKDELILSNGDCIYEPSIVYDMVRLKGNLIACDFSFFSQESMKVRIGENKRLVEISKAIPEGRAHAVSIDLYKFSYEAIQRLWVVVKGFIERENLNKWTEVAINELMKITDIKPFNIGKRKWAEIDNLADLLYAEKLFTNFNYEKKKVFIVDLDGTLYLGNKVFHGAISFINRNWSKFRFYFVTNNTSCSRRTYLSKLRNIGLKYVSIDNILTPIHPLLEYLKENNISNVYCVCAEDFIRDLQAEGIDCIQDAKEYKNIQAVIVGFDINLTYEKLKEAALLLQDRSTQFLLTHPDMVCPTENGFIPDAGSIALLLENVTGRKPDKIFGKPYKEILSPLLSKYGHNEIAFIGDRLYTDKVLADNTGIDFVLVLSGETKREDVEKEEKFPAVILNKLEELEEL